jgi:hypothetical protein
MFLVQGLVRSFSLCAVTNQQIIDETQAACVIGIATYFWILEFPEKAHKSFHFCTKAESEIAVRRIQEDRGDGEPTPFKWREILKHFLDLKIYGFAATFFLLVGSAS